jgi:ABC-type multidrug transport system fused ATPase/permease subunit
MDDDITRVVKTAFRLVEPSSRRRVMGYGLASILLAALDFFALVLLVPFLSSLSGDSAGRSQGIAGGRISSVLNDTAMHVTPTHLALAAAILFLFKAVFSMILLWRQAGVLNEVQTRLAVRVVKKYGDLPWIQKSDKSTGQLIRTTSTATYGVVQVLAATNALLAESAVLIAVIVAMVVVSPFLALAVLLYLLAIGTAYSVLLRRPISERGARAQVEGEVMNTALIELVNGVRELTIRGAYDRWSERYEGALSAYLGAYRLVQVAAQSLRYLLEAAVIGGVAVLVVAITLLGSEGEILVAVGIVLAGGLRVIPALNTVLGSINQMRSNSAAVTIVSQELALVGMEKCSKKPDAQEIVLDSFESVTFSGVDFSYPGREHRALHNVTFTMNQGESIGVVGESGAGKSTLIDMLLGLIEPSGGKVLVNGENLSDVLPQWRSWIGYVPQQGHIFDASLAANVTLDPDGLSNSRVISAITRVDLATLAERLPGGYEGRLGERGRSLSGGQQQRLVMARALYSEPSILLLDEATSALDNETEKRITDAVEELRGSMTLVIVAHRLSTIRRCDRILFLSEGEVVDCAPFATLVANRPAFRRMVELGRF